MSALTRVAWRLTWDTPQVVLFLTDKDQIAEYLESDVPPDECAALVLAIEAEAELADARKEVERLISLVRDARPLSEPESMEGLRWMLEARAAIAKFDRAWLDAASKVEVERIVAQVRNADFG